MKTCDAKKAELEIITDAIQRDHFIDDSLYVKLNDSFSPALNNASGDALVNLKGLDDTMNQFTWDIHVANINITDHLKAITPKIITAAGDCLNQLQELEKANKLKYVSCDEVETFDSIISDFQRGVRQTYNAFKTAMVPNLAFINQNALTIFPDLDEGLKRGDGQLIGTIEYFLLSFIRNFEDDAKFAEFVRATTDLAATATKQFEELTKTIKESSLRFGA